MRVVTAEAVAVGLLAAALTACCFVTGVRRPRAGRLAATVVVSVGAGSTIVLAVGALVVGDPDNPDSVAGPVGTVFLVVGLLIAALAVVVQLGGEPGRWLAAAVLALLGTLVLWSGVSEPVQDDRVGGSMIVLLIGLGFMACTALLIGSSNVARRWSGGPS